MNTRAFWRSRRGAALIASFAIMIMLSIAAASYLQSATQTVRTARRQAYNLQTMHLCEAGAQRVLLSLWQVFKTDQTFTSMDARCQGASPTNARAGIGPLAFAGVGCYTAGVISITTPASDPYTRQVIVRAVGWIDGNGNQSPDKGEAQKVVDVIATYQLSRSQVFDYSYFINNYGWMNGFGPTDLIVNGDMRSNGDFSFTGGSPTVNGSVYACANDKLSPVAAGLVNTPPVKWDNSTYASNETTNSADQQNRWRQSYNSTTMGAKGSSTYENWRDIVFDTSASLTTGRISGAVISDVMGTRGWTQTSTSSTLTTNMIDASSSQEVIMPDLSDLSFYQNVSSTYVDLKKNYSDGTANPYYNQGAYIKAWNTSTSSYQTVSTGGLINGSAALVGTSAHPIIIHGPVTASQDVAISGNVQGQGTIYTGRNVHVTGSITYTNKPNFKGSNLTTIDAQNEKSDLLALAARGSVVMGDTTQFTGSYPLQYMTPPFTKGRYDSNGNWIPPYDATKTDSTGKMLYQSVLGDSVIHGMSTSINQIDAVLYTNFVGGGNIGQGSGGITINGSIISKEEAMVTYSLPMRLNYDSRIRERNLSNQPLIDLQLPRSPVMLQSAWQDRGFTFGY